MHAGENHCFASSKEHACCNTDSSSSEERVNKCTELSFFSETRGWRLQSREAKIPRRRVFWAGLSPPSCSVSLAPLLRSGFYKGLGKQLYLSLIKLTSFAGSAQPLVWQTLLSSRSEYPGQTRLRVARGGEGGSSPEPRVRGREWERNSWLQARTAWGNAS